MTVAAVVGVFRNEHFLNGLFHHLFLRLQLVEFFLGHFPHLLVLLGRDEFLGPGDVFQEFLVGVVLRHDPFQIFVFFAEFGITLRVHDYLGLYDLLPYFVKALL